MPATPPFCHIVMATDSLSLPRPWDMRRPDEFPEKHFFFRDTYPHLLQSRLRAAMPAANVQVTNIAQRSATMDTAFARRREILNWMEPSACVLQFGIVDCWVRRNEDRRFRLPLDDFASNARQLIETRDQTNPGLPLVFMGVLPTHAVHLKSQPDQNDIIAAYNQALRDLCSGRAGFVDVEKHYFEIGEQVGHADGHHLSHLGHRLYADELVRLLLLALA